MSTSGNQEMGRVTRHEERFPVQLSAPTYTVTQGLSGGARAHACDLTNHPAALCLELEGGGVGVAPPGGVRKEHSPVCKAR